MSAIGREIIGFYRGSRREPRHGVHVSHCICVPFGSALSIRRDRAFREYSTASSPGLIVSPPDGIAAVDPPSISGHGAGAAGNTLVKLS